MRVRIIFNLNNRGAVLPFHHQHLIANLLRELLESSEDCPDVEHSIQRLNFSGVKGQTKVGKSGLHYCSNKVTIVLSSISFEWIQYVVNELFSKRYVNIGKLNVSPEKVEEEEFEEILGETKYLCISPIILSKSRDDNEEQIDLFTDQLSDLLYESVMQKIESLDLYSASELKDFGNFQVIPDQKYIEKVLKHNKKISRLYTIKEKDSKIEYRGYTFPFTLYAHEKVQKLVLDCGFGEFTNCGFGMLDVVGKKVKLKHNDTWKNKFTQSTSSFIES